MVKAVFILTDRLSSWVPVCMYRNTGDAILGPKTTPWEERRLPATHCQSVPLSGLPEPDLAFCVELCLD
ncbi:hypothetical protein ILYODFUR_005937 [Ilyodon furcidens]|uniref:Uncharacterized protein n=1 Tax=Ilyodon furcidens TaxID=33524 RepID=A0ABV0UT38_9TELE